MPQDTLKPAPWISWNRMSLGPRGLRQSWRVVGLSPRPSAAGYRHHTVRESATTHVNLYMSGIFRQVQPQCQNYL